MPTFERCPKEVNDMAWDIIEEFKSHQPLADANVTIDFVFAYSDKDEKTGAPVNDALTLHGKKALGICRKIPLKDRALNRGDAEIAIDGDWWTEASTHEQKALLDHELHHIEVKMDDRGVVTDDLKRPVLKMRKHDVDIGWFNIVAQRHGVHSQERIQAKTIMANNGQYYWPDLVEKAKEHGDTVERAVAQVRNPKK